MAGESQEGPPDSKRDSSQSKEPLDRVVDQTAVLKRGKHGFFTKVLDLITRQVPEKAMDAAGKAQEKIGNPTALNPFETRPPIQPPTQSPTSETGKS